MHLHIIIICENFCEIFAHTHWNRYRDACECFQRTKGYQLHVFMFSLTQEPVNRHWNFCSNERKKKQQDEAKTKKNSKKKNSIRNIIVYFIHTFMIWYCVQMLKWKLVSFCFCFFLRIHIKYIFVFTYTGMHICKKRIPIIFCLLCEYTHILSVCMPVAIHLNVSTLIQKLLTEIQSKKKFHYHFSAYKMWYKTFLTRKTPFRFEHFGEVDFQT